jgi:hypothetical protein
MMIRTGPFLPAEVGPFSPRRMRLRRLLALRRLGNAASASNANLAPGVLGRRRCARERRRGPRRPDQDPVAQQRHALVFWDHVVDGADSIAFRLMFNSLRAAYEPLLAALATVMQVEVGRPEA